MKVKDKATRDTTVLHTVRECEKSMVVTVDNQHGNVVDFNFVIGFEETDDTNKELTYIRMERDEEVIGMVSISSSEYKDIWLDFHGEVYDILFEAFPGDQMHVDKIHQEVYNAIENMAIKEELI